MASTSFDAAVAAAALTSNNAPSFVFDIYDDGRVGSAMDSSPSAPQALPSGQCNFVDLTHGSSGPQCGCRRFWSRSKAAAGGSATPVAPASGFGASNGSLDLSDAGWCMCSHHACFHDQAPQAPQAPLAPPAQAPNGMAQDPPLPPSFLSPAAAASLYGGVMGAPGSPSALLPGQENERPRPNREPLSPVQDPTAFQIVAKTESNENDFLSFGLNAPLPPHLDPIYSHIFADATSDVAPAAPAAATGPYPESTIPDTLSWGHAAPSIDGQFTLPNSTAPSQTGSLLPPSHPPPPPSTASSTSQTRYIRPFAGRGLHTLTSVPAASPLRQPILEEDVAAEVSGQVSHDLTTQDTASHEGTLRGISGAVQAHEMRLERLENPSFSFVPGQEEWQDKHDHMDMRVTELESRVDDVEKRLNQHDEASTTASIVISRRRLLGRDDDATTVSGVSMATASTHSTETVDVASQLQQLRDQVRRLQSASLPLFSSATPWQLEVVFLPFPLKGVWVEAVHFATTSAVAAAAAAQRRQAGGARRNSRLSGPDEDDEWTQMPNTLSRQTPDPQSPFAADWADATAADAPRLLPRACAPGKAIDNRLKSRGLVQMLSVHGSDARSLQLAMAAAFGPVLRTMISSPVSSQESTTSNSQFLGLQQSWVPLRKIHKDSRLRFLTRAEMLTPALWDAPFLMSSVVMKATGLHRLYVTQPEAYLQDRRAYRSGWSWHRLQQLKPVEPASGDAGWSWDSRLDDPPTAPTVSRASSARLTPFSRESTPVGRPRASSRAHTMPAGTVPALHASRSSHASSTQQFFTVAQSPLVAAAGGSTSLRRSPSPFFVPVQRSAQQQRPSSAAAASRRPPPIHTTSMPTPRLPATGATTVALSSPVRRMRSTGRSLGPRASPSASTSQQQHALAACERRERHAVSPFGSGHRPSPRTAVTLPSPLMTGQTSNGIDSHRYRRRSKDSPGLFWPRNTPGRSMSRSRSPSAPPAVVWGTAADYAPRVRGTTPFAYATPYSNAPPSSRQRSRGPVAAVDDAFDGDNDADVDADDYDYDPDSEMPPSQESDNYDDCPMTQDGDEEDSKYNIKVFEDEEDTGGHDTTQAEQQSQPLRPEDVVWPGIEDGDDEYLPASDEHDDGDGDEHMSDSENMEPQSSEAEMIDSQEVDTGFGQQPSAASEANQASQPSQASDAPSEYPSTQHAWLQRTSASRDEQSGSGIGFRIHEDGDAM